MSFNKTGSDAKCKVVGVIKTSEELTEDEKKLATLALEELNKKIAKTGK